jgi:hypothetical protein
MSKTFLWSTVVAISLLAAGGVAALSLHASPAGTFATSSVSIDPFEAQATIKLVARAAVCRSHLSAQSSKRSVDITPAMRLTRGRNPWRMMRAQNQ